MIKLKEIEEIEPTASRCISVDSPDRLFAVGAGDHQSNRVMTHNSVVQQNIIIGCVLRPDSWRFLGVDLKRVELSGYQKYSHVVQGIATVLEDALVVLRFAQQTMMKRYEELEAVGKKDFLDLPEKGQALMVMVDELAELISPSGVKALSENTIIPNLNGRKNLSEIQIGDTVFDNYGNKTTVSNKYIPSSQERYKLNIRSNRTNTSEEFIAGSEHNWVAYFTYPDGEVEGPEIVETSYLHEFKKAQDTLPKEDRTQIKFKRSNA